MLLVHKWRLDEIWRDSRSVLLRVSSGQAAAYRWPVSNLECAVWQGNRNNEVMPTKWKQGWRGDTCSMSNTWQYKKLEFREVKSQMTGIIGCFCRFQTIIVFWLLLAELIKMQTSQLMCFSFKKFKLLIEQISDILSCIYVNLENRRIRRRHPSVSKVTSV